jgi:hypothetical protein
MKNTSVGKSLNITCESRARPAPSNTIIHDIMIYHGRQ